MTDAPMPMSTGTPLTREVESGGSLPFWAVFKREVMLYFRSPVAYAIAFAVLLFMGLLFNAYVVQLVRGQLPVDSTYAPNLLTFLMFLIAPLLTMRLLAEESREGTLEVLMTLPMGDWQYVLGKFLAAWAYYTLLLLITLVYHFVNMQIGVPDMGATFGAYVGAWLYGGGVIAVCMIWSAVTEDQIVAAFLSAATVLILYLAEQGATALSTNSNMTIVANILRELSLTAHFNNFMAQGIFRLHDVLYFVFLIIGALFITTRIVEARRWRA
jgi:ABC-2 type transport system permease protein